MANRIRGIDVGLDDFVGKPFNAHELRARIRCCFWLKARPAIRVAAISRKAAAAALGLLARLYPVHPPR